MDFVDLGTRTVISVPAPERGVDDESRPRPIDLPQTQVDVAEPDVNSLQLAGEDVAGRLGSIPAPLSSTVTIVMAPSSREVIVTVPRPSPDSMP